MTENRFLSEFLTDAKTDVPGGVPPDTEDVYGKRPLTKEEHVCGLMAKLHYLLPDGPKDYATILRDWSDADRRAAYVGLLYLHRAKELGPPADVRVRPGA